MCPEEERVDESSKKEKEGSDFWLEPYQEIRINYRVRAQANWQVSH